MLDSVIEKNDAIQARVHFDSYVGHCSISF